MSLTLAVVVILVDVRRGLEEDDLELIAFIDAAKAASRRPVQIVLVATKLDKVPRSSRRAALSRVSDATRRKVLGFSAITGEGRDELWRVLRRAALGDEAHATIAREDATAPLAASAPPGLAPLAASAPPPLAPLAASAPPRLAPGDAPDPASTAGNESG
jgi:GTP-binding protein